MGKHAQSALPGLLALALVFGVTPAQGAAGSLDTTFGKGGIVETNFASDVNVSPLAAALQTNGDILVLAQFGNGAAAVVRYTPTGAVDTTFGTKGVAELPTPFDGPTASMALQSNGKIVVAGVVGQMTGDAAFAVARFNTNGTADTTFGSGGEVSTALGFPGVGESVLIEPDGAILVGAQLEPAGRGLPFETALIRYDANGTLDSTFGDKGTVSVTSIGGCTALGLLSDGEIMVLNGSAIAQFTSTGTLEATVTGGPIAISTPSQVPSLINVFQPNGEYIYAQTVAIGAGRNGNDAVQVLRYTATGSVDSTFVSPTFHFVGTGGTANRDSPSGVALQANGEIVVVGTHSVEFANVVNGLARLETSGSFDATFGTDGIVINSLPTATDGLSGVLIQPADGKIVTIGVANNYTELTLGRYLPN
jgi:uncharacterized delta-60 repeat protein